MMLSPELLNEIIKEFKIIPQLTGSQFICDPRPADSDWDYVLQVPNLESEVAALVAWLGYRGFEIDAGEHYQVSAASTFISMRKDKLNFLISRNAEWCRNHTIATRLCKKLKLNNKPDRVAVFQALLYGKVPLDGEKE